MSTIDPQSRHLRGGSRIGFKVGGEGQPHWGGGDLSKSNNAPQARMYREISCEVRGPDPCGRPCGRPWLHPCVQFTMTSVCSERTQSTKPQNLRHKVPRRRMFLVQHRVRVLMFSAAPLGFAGFGEKCEIVRNVVMLCVQHKSGGCESTRSCKLVSCERNYTTPSATQKTKVETESQKRDQVG